MRKICCFAGHSSLLNRDTISQKLSSKIEDLIINNCITEFWVGNYGAFDSLSAFLVYELKKKYPFIELNLIVPYLTAEITNNKNLYFDIFDNILIADIPEKTPKQFHIIKCNEYMIKKSDFLICFVDFHWGGAYKTLEYAKRQKHIKIFNIAE